MPALYILAFNGKTCCLQNYDIEQINVKHTECHNYTVLSSNYLFIYYICSAENRTYHYLTLTICDLTLNMQNVLSLETIDGRKLQALKICLITKELTEESLLFGQVG